MKLDKEAGRICRWVATDGRIVGSRRTGTGLCGGEEREKKKEKEENEGKRRTGSQKQGGKKSRKRRNARDQDGGALCTLDRERKRERERERDTAGTKQQWKPWQNGDNCVGNAARLLPLFKPKGCNCKCQAAHFTARTHDTSGHWRRESTPIHRYTLCSALHRHAGLPYTRRFDELRE